MIIKNYYKILGLTRDATEKDIKKAYRNLAVELHPSRSKHENAKALFIEVTEAFEILSKKRKKKNYDILYDHYYGATVEERKKVDEKILNKKEDQQVKETPNPKVEKEVNSWAKKARKTAKNVAEGTFEVFADGLLDSIGDGLFAEIFDLTGNLLDGAVDVIAEFVGGVIGSIFD